MQKGRSREFFQWNIDMLGVNSSEADADWLPLPPVSSSGRPDPAQARIYVNTGLYGWRIRAAGNPDDKKAGLRAGGQA